MLLLMQTRMNKMKGTWERWEEVAKNNGRKANERG
jgi:hypothetical protein